MISIFLYDLQNPQTNFGFGIGKNTEKRNNGENTEMKNSNPTISKEPANLLKQLSAAKLCFS